MKKDLFILLISVILIIAIVSIYIYNYQVNQKMIEADNKMFESYYNKELYGVDFATLMNKVDDINRKNNVEKDEKGLIIENEENSLKIEIKFKEAEDIISSEKIVKKGSQNFVENYGDFTFKCTKIEYHNKTNKVKYMFFEEI